MLIHYAVAHSLYCAKLRIVLRAKGLEWHEQSPPGGAGSAAYRALVPSGNLPALADGDLVIADSEAIAEYLDEQYPLPPLMPKSPASRARMRERARFHDTRLEPTLRALFRHIAPDKRDAALNARQSDALTERLAQLGQILNAAPDLAFGLGDCGYPVTFLWIDALTPALGLTPHYPARVIAYRDRLESVPAVAAELAAYRPAVQEWMAKATA
ncbi:MAG: glutathione S-transferase family protein [Paracoccaceae bacterium]|nr:glutathione S-transferase family protein [Paracoccaceae bacterium]